MDVFFCLLLRLILFLFLLILPLLLLLRLFFFLFLLILPLLLLHLFLFLFLLFLPLLLLLYFLSSPSRDILLLCLVLPLLLNRLSYKHRATLKGDSKFAFLLTMRCLFASEHLPRPVTTVRNSRPLFPLFSSSLPHGFRLLASLPFLLFTPSPSLSLPLPFNPSRPLPFLPLRISSLSLTPSPSLSILPSFPLSFLLLFPFLLLPFPFSSLSFFLSS